MIRKMLVGDPARLRFVNRFSTCHVVHKESVAEHSYYVCLYSLLIGDWCNYAGVADETGQHVNMARLLQRAVLHDIEEALTGDVNRLFKYSTDATFLALHQGGRQMMYRLVSSLDIPDHRQRTAYYNAWENAKDNSIEGRVLEFADFLSVLSYMVQEVNGSNFTMREHLSTMTDYLRIFENSRFDFIRPLVVEAANLLCEAFSAAGLRYTLEEKR